MKTIHAYQCAPEDCDSSSTWDDLKNMDCRLWYIIGDGKQPIDLAIEALNYLAYSPTEDEISEWIEYAMDLYTDSSIADISQQLGWNRLEWEEIKDKIVDFARGFEPCLSVGDYRPFNKYATELLSIVAGLKFTLREIRGNCQGDWAELVLLDDEYTDELVDEIEALYFNTGDQWLVEVDDDIHCIYTWKHGDEQSNQLKQLIDCVCDDEKEIIIHKFAGYEPRVAKYEEPYKI